ncbi:hypothetical protein AB0I22_33770 [Streptomyces sp. NPDC050610]|uniref:hypothetical protein n=1 Tax=Streptomyces sp. NPDC050610 TaxID=3157097 RepID=UPI0034179CA6
MSVQTPAPPIARPAEAAPGRGDFLPGPDTTGVLVDVDVAGACCRDTLALALELARHLGADSTVHVTAAIVTAEPVPMTPVVTEYGGFRAVPDQARRPRRIQPVTTLVSPTDEDDLLRETAQETFSDLMHQFGITVHL